MKSRVWKSSWGYHLRRLRRSGTLRWASLLALGTALIGGFTAFTSDVSATNVASNLQWATWAAVFASCAALSEATPARCTTLLQARGIDAHAQQGGAFGARATLVAAAFAFPAAVIGLGLLCQADSLREVTATLLAVLGLLLSAAVLSGCLVLLGVLSRQLSPQRPGGMLLALVLAPDLLRQALPEVPSLLALHSWLVQLSLLGIA